MHVHLVQVASILLTFAAYVPAETPPDQPDHAGAAAVAAPPHRGGGQMLGMLERLSAYAESSANDQDADAKWARVEEHFKNANKDQFDRMDTDADGHISREEATAAVVKIAARIKERSPELFNKLDANGDGKLSHEEIKSALDAMHSEHPHGDHPPSGDGSSASPQGHDGEAPPPSSPDGNK